MSIFTTSSLDPKDFQKSESQESELSLKGKGGERPRTVVCTKFLIEPISTGDGEYNVTSERLEGIKTKR